MKKKEWEEIKNYTQQELLSRLTETQKKYMELKLKHSVVPLKNPHELRSLRKDIARIKTLLWQKFKFKT